jgi:CHASE3 domain sensor protein
MSLEDELNELGKELGQAGDAMRQGVQIAGNALYVALVIVVLVILLIAVLSIHYP